MKALPTAEHAGNQVHRSATSGGRYRQQDAEHQQGGVPDRLVVVRHQEADEAEQPETPEPVGQQAGATTPSTVADLVLDSSNGVR
ncbi:hypothetical protein, partial [Streptomyces sp. NPDC058755]|uniref:hypothetical protein n=1 Tax=Streptomyces sp. NPDC058755 TaxID=3346624 RepID=UPI0036AF1513